MADDKRRLLSVEALVTGYGKRQVLHGVTLNVAPGEIVSLIGHNGAGKSTLLKAIFGMLPVWAGRVAVDGTWLKVPSPRELLRAGVAYIPQGNRVFSELSVRENLEMGATMLSEGARLKERIEKVFTLFPVLRLRLRQRAGTLSGGEKQMLALANLLVLSPRLFLLDEPSLGLAPSLVADALNLIQQINRDSGTAVLIVEQKVREIIKIARRVYVLRNGRISFSGTAESLQDENKMRDVYL